MNFKQGIIIILIFFTISSFSQSNHIAGFRASRILSSYPNNQFPDENYWINTGNSIASKFDSTAPAAIWIVGLYWDDGVMCLNFPSPGPSYNNIEFTGTDQNESYLTQFDNQGFNVWLQVEPGGADIDTLMDLVFNQYQQHPCVKGFAIDIEWYNTHLYSGGQHVTDAKAQTWEQKLKSINPEYTLFLKHYAQSWMPPVYRGDIMFVDDSQNFPSLSSMNNEFSSWGTNFYPNNVIFQFGYSVDKPWWSQYADPVYTIGNTLISDISNCYGVFWVDFTINDIFPVNPVNILDDFPNDFNLNVYPNPFKDNLTITYTLNKKEQIKISLTDILGREIAFRLPDNSQNKGKHKININISELKISKGTYLLRFLTKTNATIYPVKKC